MEGLRRFCLQWQSLLRFLEVLLAVASVIIVLIGFVYFVPMVVHTPFGAVNDLQPTIEHLLAQILLFVVGIELSVMLIKRTPECLIEIMFFVVARKLLLTGSSATDLLLGVIAMAGLFAIRKYLTIAAIEA